MFNEIFMTVVLFGQVQMNQQQIQGLTSPGMNSQSMALTTLVPPSMMVLEHTIRRSIPGFDRPVRKILRDKKKNQ
jgi:hypothetical protein